MSRLFSVTLLVLLAAWLCGCSTAAPTQKPVASESQIQERDFTDDTPVESRSDTQIPPAVTQPPPSAGSTQHTVEPGQRQPYRYKFRDRKGTGKNWEPSDEPPAKKED